MPDFPATPIDARTQDAPRSYDTWPDQHRARTASISVDETEATLRDEREVPQIDDEGDRVAHETRPADFDADWEGSSK